MLVQRCLQHAFIGCLSLFPVSAAFAQASGGEYVIGGIQDMSGPLAYVGTGLATGARAYFEAVNARGGIKGHPVKYIPLDHRSDPTAGIANIKNLSQGSNAVAIMGFDSSVIVDATLKEVERAKVVAVVQGSSPASMKSNWFFNGAAFQGNQGPSMIALAEQKVPGPKRKAAIIYQESAVGVALHNDLVGQFKSRSWDLVSDQSVTLASTEVSTQVGAIAKEAPDAVFSNMSGPKIALMVNGLRKQGYTGLIINTTAAADVVSLKTVNDPNFFAMREYAFPGDSGAGVARMNEEIRKVGADPNTAWIINGYVQAAIIAQSLAQCGWPCPSDKLADTMSSSKLEMEGITVGPIAYSPTDHKGFTKVRFYRWSDSAGKPETVGADVDY